MKHVVKRILFGKLYRWIGTKSGALVKYGQVYDKGNHHHEYGNYP